MMERVHVLVCAGTGCTSSQSDVIVEKFRSYVRQFDLQEEVKVIKTGCFGLCQKGPIVAIHPDKTFYCHVTPADVEEIVVEHLYKGRPVKRLELSDIDDETKEKVFDIDKIRFYAKQMRIALKNCGVINPEDIDEYIAQEGYMALGKALESMSPQQVIDEIKKSGLRGRGGGGFPTGLKWQFAANQPKGQKYVICNADEGDPGAFMDRSILEGDPHAVLEAMAIAGYAIGANHGYVYIRAEYPIAVERLEIAIDQAKNMVCLVKKSSVQNLILILKYVWVPEHLYAVKKLHLLLRLKANAVCRCQNRHFRQSAGFGENRRLSIMLKLLPMFRSFC
jgi:(2Fe-2S) ferredoxin